MIMLEELSWQFTADISELTRRVAREMIVQLEEISSMVPKYELLLTIADESTITMTNLMDDSEVYEITKDTTVGIFKKFIVERAEGMERMVELLTIIDDMDPMLKNKLPSGELIINGKWCGENYS